MVEAAGIELIQYGYDVVLLDYGTKVPSFKGWNVRGPPSRAEIRCHTRRRLHNLGIDLRQGLIVVDVDAVEERGWAEDRFGKTPLVTVTSRGFHLYYRRSFQTRKRVRLLGKPIDILVEKATAPPSWTADNECRYTWESGLVRKSELPELDQSAIPEEPKPLPKPVPVAAPLDDERAIRYVQKIDPSIMGENGSSTCIKACLKILSLTQGDVERAWPLLMFWNQKCEPPWDTEAKEGPDSLWRKLMEARKFWKPR